MEQYYNYSQCINCLLCYAACPQYGLTPTFTGPAALALLHRYNADSRDQGWTARSDVAELRRRRLALHAGRLLLRGVPEERRSGARDQPEQGQQHLGLLRRAEASVHRGVRQMSGRFKPAVKTYTRPVTGGWWKENPFFIRVHGCARLTAVFVFLYALVLLLGLFRLALGEDAYDAWRAALADLDVAGVPPDPARAGRATTATPGSR